MFAVSAVTLIINGLTLSLALGFLLIILWQDSQKRQNQFFAVFLFMVLLWNVGSMILQATILIGFDSYQLSFAIGILELGFSGSNVALYVLVTILVGAHTRDFRILAFLSLVVVIGYRLVFIMMAREPIYLATFNPATYRFEALPILFYFAFNGITLYLAWQYRRKLRSRLLGFGLGAFIIGQGLSFLNPEMAIVSMSINISSLGALLIGMAILQQEIIAPLAERVTQVETMHRVSLAISSQLAIDTVLNEIAKQAAGWLEADGVGIFLREGEELELVSVYNLPPQMRHTVVPLGQGVAGTVAETQSSIYIENYGRDWHDKADLPLAKETFGAVICVPLTYGNQVIGALMVIAGRQGRLFRREDVYLLELLGAQAAVAIAHSRLFEEQRELTQQVEDARSQLEALLVSTENPVIAVNRNFRLIFANPAARRIFDIPYHSDDEKITQILPAVAFPRKPIRAMRDIQKSGAHVYEISLDEQVYLCHLAGLGRQRSEGWVAVMNDITQLKELDRIKSEMVRMVSHDLKNPLMGAMLYLELMRDTAMPEQLENLSTVERQLERMNRIIRGVLDLEKIRTGEMKTGLCYADKMVDITVRELKRLASDKNIALEVEIEGHPLAFLGDAEQFERALINLVENAIKFTLEGGTVSVSVRSIDDKLVFKVRDTGIGIPKELHQQVFERFFRGRQKGVEHVTGSGLGLSIVKSIVENHRGKIWLESAEGQGTTFYVTVPLATSYEMQAYETIT